MKLLSAVSATLILAVDLIFSQQVSEMRIVGSPKEESTEIVAKDNRDANGNVCAGLIFYSDLIGLTFQSNNGIVKVNKEQGKDFLFLSPDERMVEVYCKGYSPLKIILNEVGIRLKSGQTWSVKLTGDKKLDLIPVNFIVKPEGTTLTIDGKNKGAVSLQQLPEGKHDIRIEKEGYTPLEQSISVSATQNLFNFTLQEVELQTVTISSTPEGAKIYLDNTEKGETNKQTFLYPGRYNLKLTKNGFIDIQQTIEIKEGANNKFTFTLNKNAGTLSLSVTPSDARIFINREDFTGKNTMELAPGRYKIEVEKNGYNGLSETMDIVLGKRVEKIFTLTPKTGGLQFSVTPMDAKVVLMQNGNILQRWEGAKILRSLQIGDYDIEINANGFTAQRKQISILENKVIVEDITLKKGIESAIVSNGIEFVLVEGGTFKLGGTDVADEKPIHDVTLSSFYMGKYEVTQKQWFSVMGGNPTTSSGENLPMNNVSWNDIQEFLTKLNAREPGNTYRLPTEAEWEYAARGGNKSRGYTYSGANSLDDIAWYSNNSLSTVHEVGTKQPNELGLHDMNGNLWEWCNDWYLNTYYQSSPEKDPPGPNTGTYHLVKGGSWFSTVENCRLSFRPGNIPDKQVTDYGFRIVKKK